MPVLQKNHRKLKVEICAFFWDKDLKLHQSETPQWHKICQFRVWFKLIRNISLSVSVSSSIRGAAMLHVKIQWYPCISWKYQRISFFFGPAVIKSSRIYAFKFEQDPLVFAQNERVTHNYNTVPSAWSRMMPGSDDALQVAIPRPAITMVQNGLPQGVEWLGLGGA